MKCQNCGKNEVNFKYTQVINGVKKEMQLCNECARELGLQDMDFSMPINISSFFSDFFNEYDDSFLPSFTRNETLKCSQCGTTFDDFVNTGEFGCGNCYIAFSDRISPILKNLHGSNVHIGRTYKHCVDELEYNKNKFQNDQKNKKKENNKTEQQTELEKLEKELEKAVKEERYEDAAKIRDEIKKINKGE